MLSRRQERFAGSRLSCDIGPHIGKMEPIRRIQPLPAGRATEQQQATFAGSVIADLIVRLSEPV
jgi:hypothetical protein